MGAKVGPFAERTNMAFRALVSGVGAIVLHAGIATSVQQTREFCLSVRSRLCPSPAWLNLPCSFDV